MATKYVSLSRDVGSNTSTARIAMAIEAAELFANEETMVELKVTGMTCNGCVNSVKRAINRVYPNASVEVELSTGLVRIDGEVELGRAEESITKAGFGVAGAQP